MHLGRWPLAALAVIALAGCGDDDDTTASTTPASGRDLILATTTSTQDSGLLDELVPAFERETGYKVKTVAVGSGAAIELGERGEADVVLAHSPKDEEALMATGKAGERRIVMHNDFVIVGPPGDPAGIKGRAPPDALKRIAAAQAPFISRGDDSGTHNLELKLWEQAGRKPGGPGYAETGQGMGPTLRVADERGGYTLTDRGTYLAQRKNLDGLVVLVEGDPGLLNVYHVIDMTKRAGDRVNAAGAAAFAQWITSPAAQRLIGRFGRAEFGRPLFVPDAGKTEDEVREAA
jgi:tungstate transport system substrate-binding protein